MRRRREKKNTTVNPGTAKRRVEKRARGHRQRGVARRNRPVCVLEEVGEDVFRKGEEEDGLGGDEDQDGGEEIRRDDCCYYHDDYD